MKKVLPILLLSICGMLSPIFAQNKPISLTNTSGKSVSVYLKKVNQTEVFVNLASNRKSVTIKLADLDHASKEKIKKWQAEGGGLSTDFEIDFDSGKTSRSRDNYYDDRVLTLKPVITIKNDDRNLESKVATVTALVLGRPAADTSLFTVFLKETHKLPAISGGDEHFIKMKSFRTTYDKQGYKHGSKYLGYIVLIHDKQEIIASKSIPSPMVEKYAEKLLKLKQGKYYDKDLTVIKYNDYYTY